MYEQREPVLSELALKILKERYLLKGPAGEVIETPGEMYLRAARTMGRQEKTPEEQERWTRIFYDTMVSLDWSPSSPCLMNSDTPLQQLSACFILDIGDSMEDIFSTLKNAALIYKTGGGVGFNFGKLREKGALISTTKGVSGGILSWLKVYDTAIEAIAQGGKRRGAALGIMPVNHPDILDWIRAKAIDKEITNFNLSVSIDDEFMKAVDKDLSIPLISPLGYVSKRVPAKKLWEELTYQAWANGEPGLFFVDRANIDNPNPHLGTISGGNPCSEFLAIPNSSCNLASINLEQHLICSEDGSWNFDWKKFRTTIHVVVRFLDNMIDANNLPLAFLKDTALATRPIGLGFMGLARVLKALALGYNTGEGRIWADKMVSFLRKEAIDASLILADQRGVYPAWNNSLWESKGLAVRNSNLLSIAPTGTIATLTNTSWSLEPEFAPMYQRRILNGKVFWEMDPQLEKAIITLGLNNQLLIEELEAKGSIQDMPQFPPEIKKVFVYALDISPADHLKMQAVIQKHVDGAISKTINLPEDAAVKDVSKAFIQAYKLGLKGCTVYRQGTRLDQVLSLTSSGEKNTCVIGSNCPSCF